MSDFKLYIKAQQERFNKDRVGGDPKRINGLVDFLENIYELNQFNNALVIGCGDGQELKRLRERGVSKVSGIDLNVHIDDKEVIEMDMHDLKEVDKYDLIYMSHSLEHSYNPKKVIANVVRAAVNGCIILIEIPINYAVNDIDRHDFENCDKILDLFECEKNVIFAKEYAKGEDTNFCGSDIARLIFEVIK